MDPDAKVLCYSGGLDCYCLDQLEEYDTYVFFNVGTEESKYELDLVIDHIPEENLEVVDFHAVSQFEMEDATVPLRNVMFTFFAANYGNVIHLGETFADRFDVKDSDEVAANLASTLLNHFNAYGQNMNTMPRDHSRYDVEFPVCDLTKGELLQRVVDETDETVESVFENTKSCHYGNAEQGCGKCEGCLRRATAAGYVLGSSERFATVLDEEFRVNPLEYYENEDNGELRRLIVRRGREYDQFNDVYGEWLSKSL